jgi:hypothetical protein
MKEKTYINAKRVHFHPMEFFISETLFVVWAMQQVYKGGE